MNKAKYLNDVLTNMEAEELIAKIYKEIAVDKIGSEEFIKHHTLLERLNMQAIKNALLGGDDFILENFVTYEKMKQLIGELFVIHNFKNLIYPKIIAKVPEAASCKMYICLYHEAVVINLLENFYYHVTACQASEDYIIDIIEYCYSKICRTVNKGQVNKKIEAKVNNTQQTLVEEMNQKFEEIEFCITMACISIIRYITDHLNQLPFPVRNHLMNVKDVPMLLVALMEQHPWIRRETKSNIETVFVFENNQWSPATPSKLPKLEAQVWITIFNLFMNAENNKKYEITDFRKSNLLRLRKFMNESLYDQIPPLQQLYRALEEISLMEFSSVPTSNPFVVEMVPILFSRKFSEDEIDSIALKILKDYFPPNYNSQTFKKEMDIISEIYSVDNIEYFMEDPKCANCGKDASSRCSKCKSEWYCGKDCQIKRWKQHKEICVKMDEINKQMNSCEIDDNTVKEINKIISPEKEKEKEFIKEVKREFDELD